MEEHKMKPNGKLFLSLFPPLFSLFLEEISVVFANK